MGLVQRLVGVREILGKQYPLGVFEDGSFEDGSPRLKTFPFAYVDNEPIALIPAATLIPYKIIETKQGKMIELLCIQDKKGVWKGAKQTTGKWTFPGGEKNPGESFLGAATRECCEETTCKVIHPPPIIHKYTPKEKAYVFHNLIESQTPKTIILQAFFNTYPYINRSDRLILNVAYLGRTNITQDCVKEIQAMYESMETIAQSEVQRIALISLEELAELGSNGELKDEMTCRIVAQICHEQHIADYITNFQVDKHYSHRKPYKIKKENIFRVTPSSSSSS